MDRLCQSYASSCSFKTVQMVQSGTIQTQTMTQLSEIVLCWILLHKIAASLLLLFFTKEEESTWLIMKLRVHSKSLFGLTQVSSLAQESWKNAIKHIFYSSGISHSGVPTVRQPEEAEFILHSDRREDLLAGQAWLIQWCECSGECARWRQEESILGQGWAAAFHTYLLRSLWRWLRSE